mgnify:CR=1 FL=1
MGIFKDKVDVIYRSDFDKTNKADIRTLVLEKNARDKHDKKIQKPVFEKLTNENYEGVTITQNEIKDFVLSTIEIPLKVGLFTFEAKFCWVRETNNKISSYFIKSGKSFLTDNYGFESDRPVTIYSNQSIGAIISNGAILKLKGSNMGSIKFDTNVKILNSGQDYIQVELEPGTFYFE